MVQQEYRDGIGDISKEPYILGLLIEFFLVQISSPYVF